MSCASTSSRPARAAAASRGRCRSTPVCGSRSALNMVNQCGGSWYPARSSSAVDRGLRRMLSRREAGADHHPAGPQSRDRTRPARHRDRERGCSTHAATTASNAPVRNGRRADVGARGGRTPHRSRSAACPAATSDAITRGTGQRLPRRRRDPGPRTDDRARGCPASGIGTLLDERVRRAGRRRAPDPAAQRVGAAVVAVAAAPARRRSRQMYRAAIHRARRPTRRTRRRRRAPSPIPSASTPPSRLSARCRSHHELRLDAASVRALAR